MQYPFMRKLISLFFLSIFVVPANLSSGFEFEGSIYSIEMHKRLNMEAALEPYNNWCRGNANNDVLLTEEAIKIFGDESLGQPILKLIDMSYLECPGGTDTWNMGNIKLGSGGSEMALIVESEYLVRFTAMSVEISFETNGDPIIKANIHPVYCQQTYNDCVIEMIIPKKIKINLD